MLITNASRLGDFFCYFFLRAEDCAESRQRLFISFGAVVSLAEHLAVVYICCAPFAPCSDVVSIHLGEFPYLSAVSTIGHGTVRTVAHSLRMCLSRLARVNAFLSGFIKATNF